MKKDYGFKDCSQCGRKFKVKNYNQRFCSDKCRDEWHNQIKMKAIEMYRQKVVSNR